ncbi:MAG: hypothetical protein IE916_06095 [Epsilonproteobacteria bacterium]|nr:hypothetical protein [Campylobacterota bacterium]
MSEPRLENIEDYNTLKGEKKRVVLTVILAGLIIGVIYAIAFNVYDNKEDTIEVQETVKRIPLR